LPPTRTTRVASDALPGTRFAVPPFNRGEHGPSVPPPPFMQTDGEHTVNTALVVIALS
jgi:hypothetical protein